MSKVICKALAYSDAIVNLEEVTIGCRQIAPLVNRVRVEQLFVETITFRQLYVFIFMVLGL